MSKTQYWTLNVVGGACALFILINIILSQLNAQSERAFAATQAQINRVRQTQTTMQNLAVRTAQAAQSEPALIELLNRHNLKVNLNVEGQVRQIP